MNHRQNNHPGSGPVCKAAGIDLTGLVDRIVSLQDNNTVGLADPSGARLPYLLTRDGALGDNVDIQAMTALDAFRVKTEETIYAGRRIFLKNDTSGLAVQEGSEDASGVCLGYAEESKAYEGIGTFLLRPATVQLAAIYDSVKGGLMVPTTDGLKFIPLVPATDV